MLRARRTFREGFVSQQTQTMPDDDDNDDDYDDEYDDYYDDDDDDDDEEFQERTLSIKLAFPLI